MESGEGGDTWDHRGSEGMLGPPDNLLHQARSPGPCWGLCLPEDPNLPCAAEARCGEGVWAGEWACPGPSSGCQYDSLMLPKLPPHGQGRESPKGPPQQQASKSRGSKVGCQVASWAQKLGLARPFPLLPDPAPTCSCPTAHDPSHTHPSGTGASPTSDATKNSGTEGETVLWSDPSRRDTQWHYSNSAVPSVSPRPGHRRESPGSLPSKEPYLIGACIARGPMPPPSPPAPSNPCSERHPARNPSPRVHGGEGWEGLGAGCSLLPDTEADVWSSDPKPSPSREQQAEHGLQPFRDEEKLRPAGHTRTVGSEPRGTHVTSSQI